MNIRILVSLLAIPVALAASAALAGRAQGQSGGERPDLRPRSYEEVAITGGYTDGLVTGDAAGTWLATGRLIQPIDLADPAAPAIDGEPERLPHYLGGMRRRGGVVWANDGQALWRRDPAAVGQGSWQRAWSLTEGAPVPADNPNNSFDYFRWILLPDDRPELILLLTRGGLRLLELDASGRPVETAYLPRSSEQHWTIDVAYSRGFAYFVESGEGRLSLRSFDLTDPSHPIEAETYQVDYEPQGLPSYALSDWLLRAAGEQVYLAGPDRLIVLEEAPEVDSGLPIPAPRELGILALGTQPWNLLPDGQRLWLLERESVLDPSVLRGVDIADPTQPRWFGAPVTLEPTYYIPEQYAFARQNDAPGIGMARAGDHLLLSDGHGGQLRSVDIRNPAAPRVVGRLDRLGTCTGTVHSAGWTYCSSADGLIPLADGQGRPVRTQEAGTARESLSYSAAVPVEDGVAWLDLETGRLRIYGIDPPALPILFAELDLTDAYHIEVAGSYLYIAAGESGNQGQTDRLLVIDVADPHQPTVVRELQLPVEGIVSSAVGDGTLFLSSYDEGLLAMDLARPSEPRLVGRHPGAPRIRPDIAWHDGSLVVFPHDAAGGIDLIILDASDPADLRERSRFAIDDFYAVAQNSVVHALDHARGELYVFVYRSAGSGVAVLDIDDPDRVRRVADIDASAVRDISLDGDRVFISSESAGVAIWERREGEQPPSLYLPFTLGASMQSMP